MTKVIPGDGKPIVLINLENSCGEYGIILQNLTSVQVEFSDSPTDLSPQAADAQLGFTLLDNSTLVTINPFAGILYAHVNVVGASGKVAVHQFKRKKV